jgi:single-strand DNA-binding protein
MASYNKSTIMGRMGQEPKINKSAKGTTIAKFSVATTEKVNGEDETQWHDVVCFNGTAEFVEKWIAKGDQVLVEGKLKYNKYDHEKGVTIKQAVIYANEVKIAAKKNEQNDLP